MTEIIVCKICGEQLITEWIQIGTVEFHEFMCPNCDWERDEPCWCKDGEIHVNCPHCF